MDIAVYIISFGVANNGRQGLCSPAVSFLSMSPRLPLRGQENEET